MKADLKVEVPMTVEVLRDGQWVPVGWHASVALDGEPVQNAKLRLRPWQVSVTVRRDTWPMSLQLMVIDMRLRLLADLAAVVEAAVARLGLDAEPAR